MSSHDKVTMHWCFEFADGLADPVLHLPMGAGEDGGGLRVRLAGGDNGGALASIDGPHLDLRICDTPVAIGLFETKINHTQMAAPESRHDARLAAERSLLRIHARPTRIIGAREHAMGMTGDDGVDLIESGHLFGHVFRIGVCAPIADAGMAKSDHQIALSAQRRQKCAGAGDDGLRGHLAIKMDTVPEHDLRRHEADDPDAQVMGDTIFVHEATLQDHIGRQQGLVGGVAHIGADERKICAFQRAVEERQAEVEFVIAQGGRVIGERIHGDEKGMHRIGLELIHRGEEVTHGTTLKDVSIVEQQRVLDLATGFPDQARKPGEAHGRIGAVEIVIPIQREHVQV